MNWIDPYGLSGFSATLPWFGAAFEGAAAGAAAAGAAAGAAVAIIFYPRETSTQADRPLPPAMPASTMTPEEAMENCHQICEGNLDGMQSPPDPCGQGTKYRECMEGCMGGAGFSYPGGKPL